MEYQSTGPHHEAVAQPGVSPEGAVVGGGGGVLPLRTAFCAPRSKVPQNNQDIVYKQET